VLAPLRVKTLLFVLVRVPEPLITLEMVIASERLTNSALLLVTLPVPNRPVVPPAPTASVPAVIVVPPV